MAELKPCPFCGGKAELTRCGNQWYVQCAGREPIDCYCKPWTGYIDTSEIAIEVWNRRANEKEQTDA